MCKKTFAEAELRIQVKNRMTGGKKDKKRKRKGNEQNPPEKVSKPKEKNTHIHTHTFTHLQKRRNLENSQPAAGVVSSLDPEAFFSLPVLHYKCRAETKIAVQNPSKNREGISKLTQVSCSGRALSFSPSLSLSLPLSAYLTSPASAIPNLVSDHRIGIPMPKLRYGKKERSLET